jgi:hypothetical protein
MNKKKPEPAQEPPYYTLDTSLFRGRFKYFSGDSTEPVLVRAKVHIAVEQYTLNRREQDIESVTTRRGTREYFHAKPYLLIPDITLTIDLYPQAKHFADQDPAIGQVTGSYEKHRMKEVEIGQMQAWYYKSDKTIVLWECLLHPNVLDKPLRVDPNMKDLWGSFERFLSRECQGVEQITTHFHNPEYEIEEYQEFLATLGYRPVAKAAWAKAIEKA